MKPELYEAVTTKLTEGIEYEDEEEAKQSREECSENIAKYKIAYGQKQIADEEAVKQQTIDDEKMRRDSLAAKEARKSKAN